MITNTNSTIIAPEYTITCAAARNSAPSDQYSTASDSITTTSESAELIGCFCSSRLSAPATASAAKMMNSASCISQSASFKLSGFPSILNQPASALDVIRQHQAGKENVDNR